jgi:hypothetical protein
VVVTLEQPCQHHRQLGDHRYRAATPALGRAAPGDGIDRTQDTDRPASEVDVANPQADELAEPQPGERGRQVDRTVLGVLRLTVERPDVLRLVEVVAVGVVDDAQRLDVLDRVAGEVVLAASPSEVLVGLPVLEPGTDRLRVDSGRTFAELLPELFARVFWGVHHVSTRRFVSTRIAGARAPAPRSTAWGPTPDLARGLVVASCANRCVRSCPCHQVADQCKR